MPEHADLNELDFNQLFSKERPRLIKRLIRLYGDTNAEEHADDALTKLWDKYGKEPGCFRQRFDTLGKVKAWLNKAADNSFKNEARKRAARVVHISLEEISEELWASPAYIEYVFLPAQIKSLPPNLREPLELIYYGYTRKEIAGMKNIPISTLNGRVGRGLKSLREMYFKVWNADQKICSRTWVVQ